MGCISSSSGKAELNTETSEKHATENTAGSNKPVVLVIGASGNVGSATLQALSDNYSDKLEIRAGVRDPSKAEKLGAIKDVTVLKAEMGSEDLTEAFKGVDALFVVSPGTEDRAQRVIATAEAAKKAGVNHVLIVSIMTADKTDTIFGKQFSEIETAIAKMDISFCILRLPLFVDNCLLFKESIKDQGAIHMPTDPTKTFTPVVVNDVGLAAAAILSEPKDHAGKTYTLCSDTFSFSDVATAFGEALGKEVNYTQVSYDDAKEAFMEKGFPEWQVDGILELYKNVDEGTYTGDLKQLKQITGKEPTTLNDWIKNVADNFK